MERLQGGNDSRVHELQSDLIALRNELKTLQSNSKNDQQTKRETFAGLTEENEQLHLDLQKVRGVLYKGTVKEVSRAGMGLKKKEFLLSFKYHECSQLYDHDNIILCSEEHQQGNVVGLFSGNLVCK